MFISLIHNQAIHNRSQIRFHIAFNVITIYGSDTDTHHTDYQYYVISSGSEYKSFRLIIQKAPLIFYSTMLRSITFLSAMIAMVAALSVEVNIKGPERGACKGVITFVALDSDCGDCLYGVKDFRYATVKCRSQAAAEQCCKTVTKSW